MQPPATLKSGPYSLIFEPQLDPGLVRAWLEVVSAWNGPMPGGDALSQGEVYRVDGGAAGPLVFKRTFERGWKRGAMALGLREAPLQRAFRLGREASRLGLHTPMPLAYMQRRRPHDYETVLITRYVPGHQPWAYIKDRPEEKQRVLDSLAHEIACWHARGFRHRDLKGPNLLFDPQAEAAENSDRMGGVSVLDLVGASLEAPVPPLELRGHDLGRLKVSALSSGLDESDWMSLLNRYFQHSRELGIAVSRPETFGRAVAERARRKFKRNHLNRRPLA